MTIDPARLERIDVLVREGLEKRLYSAAVYALARADEVTTLRAFGWLDAPGGRPAAQDTSTGTRSVTTPIHGSLAFTP